MARMDSLDEVLRDWNRDHKKILEGLDQFSKASRAVDPLFACLLSAFSGPARSVAWCCPSMLARASARVLAVSMLV